MKITIAERLCPYCHLPGTFTMIPGTTFAVQVFPCLIRIYDLSQAKPIQVAELSLDLKGPVDQFTLFNDLEKGKVLVSGKSLDGWFRYQLIGSELSNNVRLQVERNPTKPITVKFSSQVHTLLKEESLDLLKQQKNFIAYSPPIGERLSLGINKAQDWELVNRRMNLAEILPFWHRLGQLMPSPAKNAHVGTLSLLEECREMLSKGKPEHAEQKWINAIKAGFVSLLAPQLEDTHYQGIIANTPIPNDASPISLLTEGSKLIRDLFIHQYVETIEILPFLIPLFHSGRFLNIPISVGSIDLEWTKKSIRRLIFRPNCDVELNFQFQSHVRTYRLKHPSNPKGERLSRHQAIPFKKNLYYFFDNFE